MRGSLTQGLPISTLRVSSLKGLRRKMRHISAPPVSEEDELGTLMSAAYGARMYGAEDVEQPTADSDSKQGTTTSCALPSGCRVGAEGHGHEVRTEVIGASQTRVPSTHTRTTLQPGCIKTLSRSSAVQPP